MSDNKQHQQAFDLWLSSNLKTSRPVNPSFEQTLIKKVEHIKAQKMLNYVAFQEKIAKFALIFTITGGLVLMCYPPMLKKIYLFLESSFAAVIAGMMNPLEVNPAVITLVFFVLFLFGKVLWDTIQTEI